MSDRVWQKLGKIIEAVESTQTGKHYPASAMLEDLRKVRDMVVEDDRERDMNAWGDALDRDRDD